MDPLSALALCWALVYVINLAPALMPPTWSVLAVAYLAFGVPPLPLAIGGAFAASAGRLTPRAGVAAIRPPIALARQPR